MQWILLKAHRTPLYYLTSFIKSPKHNTNFQHYFQSILNNHLMGLFWKSVSSCNFQLCLDRTECLSDLMQTAKSSEFWSSLTRLFKTVQRTSEKTIRLFLLSVFVFGVVIVYLLKHVSCASKSPAVECFQWTKFPHDYNLFEQLLVCSLCPSLLSPHHPPFIGLPF